MFQPWRSQLRQVEQALNEGRLDDAGRLLGQGNLKDFQPASRLVTRLAEQLAQRGQALTAAGDSAGGWRDWEAAVSLGAKHHELDRLEQELMARWLGEVASLLEAGQPQLAVTRLDEIEQRRGEMPHARRLRQVAAKVDAALRLERRGKFAEAEVEWNAALAFHEELPFLALRRADSRRRGEQWQQAIQKLHEKLAAGEWNDTLKAADAVLALAPDDALARDARRRAWSAVGAPLADSLADGRPSPLAPAAPRRAPAPQAIPAEVAKPSSGDARFLLWVDAVGGYLVCLGNRIVVGQPVAGHHVDVPILGDLSSRHAVIHRSGEGYLIEPVRNVQINGSPIHGPTPLHDGAILQLGAGVRLRFRRPHPLSTTACLHFVSRHRTQPPCDGIILMADSCILGPKAWSHVGCPHWDRELVLFRQAEGLACRTTGILEIDGIPRPEGGAVGFDSHLVGEELALSLESLDTT